MKTKVSVVFLILMLCMLSFNVSNATEIVSVSSQTVSENTEFYVILNLSNISYSKFKVEITNTSSLKSNEIEAEAISSLSENSGITSFIVDKASIGLDKIGIVYTSTKSGEVINFSVKITSLDDTVESLQTEVNTIIEEIDTLNTTLKDLNTTLSGITDTESEEYVTTTDQIASTESQIETKTAEQETLQDRILNFTEETQTEETSVEVTSETNNMQKSDEENPFGDDMDSIMKDKMEMMDKENEMMSMNMKEMMTKMTSLEGDLETANNTISSLTQTNTYQGSQNNYLQSLSISNVEFKNEFKKTTSDYFATVDSSVTSVTVNAVAEDSSAIVTVYGNTDLQSGKNKIIVSVTADDGSVRNYKIYVTK